MFDERLISKINELRSYQTEREWFEFKANWFDAAQLGEYISALSNAAAYEGQKTGYYIWGIQNETHEIVGTHFDPDQDVDKEPLKHWLARQLSPDLDFRFVEGEINGKRLVALLIPAAKTVPTSFRQERFIRIGSSKENLRKYPEKESYLFEVLRHGQPTIENTPSLYQDLTFEKLLIYYGAKGLKLNPDTYQRNLGLLTEDGVTICWHNYSPTTVTFLFALRSFQGKPRRIKCIPFGNSVISACCIPLMKRCGMVMC